MKKSTKRFAIGTILVGLAGYLAGILTAPKSGKETRKDIKDTTVKGIAEAEKQLKKLHTELSELLADAKGRGDKLAGKAREEYDAAVDAASAAKQKAREILSAVHEGDADDRDLKKALDDASKAVKHLRAYLKK